MNIKDIIHRRILIATKQTSYNSNLTVQEFLIMEVSPSGTYIKVRDMEGRRFWKLTADIIPIEVLDRIETNPNEI